MRYEVKGTIVMCLLLFVCVGLGVFFSDWINEQYDAFIYVPDGVRTIPNYTNIKMFRCEWCHREKHLNRHHIIPQSANPALKNEYSNIVVLCRDCHFVLGHKCNWKKFNPDVMTIVETYTNIVVSADYFEKLHN